MGGVTSLMGIARWQYGKDSLVFADTCAGNPRETSAASSSHFKKSNVLPNVRGW